MRSGSTGCWRVRGGLDREDEARDIAAELGRVAPSSQWRLKGVLAVANYFLVHNQPDQFVPLYRSCYEAFPSDPKAALCHWKVAWAAYMARQPESVEMMREHLKRYPTSSDNATGALYFLGRSAERAKTFDVAKAYYSELLERFPNHFHAVLARERMKDAAVARAVASSDTVQFLRAVKFPPRAPKKPFESNAPTKVRIERARLLAGAGLDDWATTELRFGAKTDAQPVVAAVEIAELAQERGAYHQGVHAIKALAPDFLLMPLDAAPDKFWRLAFPLPYRAALEENSRERSLDPYLVAALIRQESEFNPEVVSHANAYGLTQVVPRTGREIARKLGSRRFSTNMLLDPATNIRLGTYYLRSMLDQLDGKIEPTLAAYNAGKSRAVNWLTFGQFEEPAEFVETIPFTETRTYVQLVLRNADVYRRLYGAK